MGRNWMVARITNAGTWKTFCPAEFIFMDSGYDRPYIPILIAFRAGMAAIDWARRNQEGEWRGMSTSVRLESRRG